MVKAPSASPPTASAKFKVGSRYIFIILPVSMVFVQTQFLNKEYSLVSYGNISFLPSTLELFNGNRTIT